MLLRYSAVAVLFLELLQLLIPLLPSRMLLRYSAVAVLFLDLLQLLIPLLPRILLDCGGRCGRRLLTACRPPSESQLPELLDLARIQASMFFLAPTTLTAHPNGQPTWVFPRDLAVAVLFLELLQLPESRLPIA